MQGIRTIWWLKETPLIKATFRMAQSETQDRHTVHQQALKSFFQSFQDKRLR